MRLPPDVVALIIKIKDYIWLFGPIILVAITIKSFLLILVELKLKGKWGLLDLYVIPNSSLPNFLPFGLKILLPPFNPAGATGFNLKTIWQEAATIITSPVALLTALVLGPFLLIFRLGAGIGLGFLGGSFERNLAFTEPGQIEPGIKGGKGEPESSPKTPRLKEKWPRVFFSVWQGELDPYLGQGIYNFFIAALVTIFIPSRWIVAVFGDGRFTGPLLVPLLGLLLLPATGSEAALILALLVKGASSGTGVAALIAFPLLSLLRLGGYLRQAGLKPTFIYLVVVWLGAAGFGLFLDLFHIVADG